MTETVSITSSLLWRAALVTALIDAPLLVLIAFFLPGDLFRRLKWHLVGAGFIVYALIWGTFGSILFWDAVYHAIFPAWFHWLLPLIYGLLFGILALLFWRVSLLVTRGQAVVFCLCGGLFSLVGHSIGFSRGLMRVPMLAQASPASALAFGVFEFIFYWCVIVGLGVASRWIGLRLRLSRG
jgi:hypothetical protein